METKNILYPVENIVDRRIRRGKVEYRVRWKNYSSDTDSWEPAKSLKDTCYKLIKNFNSNLKGLNRQSCSSNTSTKLLNTSTQSSDIVTQSCKNNELSESRLIQPLKTKHLKYHSLPMKEYSDNIRRSKSPILINKTITKMNGDSVSTDVNESANKTKSKLAKHKNLFLEDYAINEPPLSKLQNKLKSVSSDEFSPNSICTFISEPNNKFPSRTTYNSMLTEQIINHITDHSKPNGLKRKISVNNSGSTKKLKIFNNELKSSTESNGNDFIDDVSSSHEKIISGTTKQADIKTSTMLNGFSVAEMKLDKCLKGLPYQKYKDSENIESVDGLMMRRKSARQMGGSNRFREIIVRTDMVSMFTEICLNNRCPSLPNCFTVRMLNELSSALKQASNDSSRVLLLSAVGKVFSSGIDLESIVNSNPNSFSHFKTSRLVTAQLANPLSHSQHLQDLAESLKRFLLQLLHFPKPIVVGINGPAIGLGCAILPLCDLIYATESSSFYLPYTSLSQFPEGGTSVTLSTLIGMPAANQLLLGGRRWSAKEALNRGLISEIIFSEKFKFELFSRCKKMAFVPSMSMETMKCMLRFQYREKIELSITLECKKLLDTWRTTEFQSSAQHFIEKELPNLLF